MANLGDAFKKAGLSSEKDERRRKHEERLHRKAVGREGLEAEQKAAEEARRAKKKARQAESRRVERERQEEIAAGEKQARVRDLIRRHAFDPPAGGRRRYHFQDRQGHLPYLLVDDEAGRKLESGQWAIVDDGRRAVLLGRADAEKVSAITADPILAWHPPKG